MIVELGNSVLEKTEYGYQVRTKHDQTFIKWKLYSKAAIEAAWEKAQKAKDRGTECIILPCIDKEKAFRLTALFSRTIFANIELTHFDGKTISFYLMTKSYWNKEETKMKVRQLTSSLEFFNNPIPLLADEIISQKSPMIKPILYLGLNGVLIMEPALKDDLWMRRWPKGEPAPGAKDFIEWAKEHFEIRWLTMKIMTGTLYEYQAKDIGEVLELDPKLLISFRNPKSIFVSDLTMGINFDEQRPWFWLQDQLQETEERRLKQTNTFDRYIATDSHNNIEALIHSWFALRDKLAALPA